MIVLTVNSFFILIFFLLMYKKLSFNQKNVLSTIFFFEFKKFDIHYVFVYLKKIHLFIIIYFIILIQMGIAKVD